jgi:hypothetical protein
MEEVIEILRLADDQCDKKLPRIHLVFGHYRGQLDIKYGEKVVFIGDCCQWNGNLGGKPLQIHSVYKDRSTVDPYDVHHKDVYVRMAKMANLLRKAKHHPYIRMEGCPVSIGELVLLLAELGGIKNPYFDKRMVVGFNRSYLAWRGTAVWNRLLGEGYQIPGTTERGEARPVLEDLGAEAEEE